VEAFLRQTGRDLDGAISGLCERLNTLTEHGIIAQVLDAANGARDGPGGDASSDPFDRDLETFARAFPGHNHAVDNLSDNLFALCHCRGGGMPEGRNVVGELRDGLPLCPRQGLGLRLDKALVLLLQLPVGREFPLPILGELAGDQAVLGFDRSVVARRPFGFVSRPLEALLPELIQRLALLLQVGSSLQRESEGSGSEGGEDPLTDEGIDGLPREILAIRAAIGDGQPVTGVATQHAWASIADLEATAALAAHQYASQQ